MSTVRAGRAIGARHSSGVAHAPRQTVRTKRDTAPTFRVVEGQRISRFTGVVVGGAIFVCFLAMLGLAVLHAVLVENQTRIERLKAEIEETREEVSTLRVEVARLASPEKVREAARRIELVAPPEIVPLPAVVPEEPSPGEAPQAVNEDVFLAGVGVAANSDVPVGASGEAG